MKGKAKKYEYNPRKEACIAEVRAKAAMEAAKTAYKEAKAALEAIRVLVNVLESKTLEKEKIDV